MLRPFEVESEYLHSNLETLVAATFADLQSQFASHRDAVSELVGDVMESAIEERLSRVGIGFRKTRRAERVPGYGDDGTARDKITRIIHLAEMSEARLRSGARGFEVIACIDGRGFGVRREDMRRLLLKTNGKVFTSATLDQLIPHTTLKDFLPTPDPGL
jgi:hypothetical protein